MDNSVSTPVKYLGPHHFPGPSASHSLVLVLKPKTQEGGGYLSRVSAYRPTPLSPLFRPPPSAPQAAAGARDPGPAVCGRGGVLQWHSGWYHQPRGRGQNPEPGGPHLRGPPVWLLSEVPAGGGRGGGDTRAGGEGALASSMEDPECKLHLPGAVLPKSPALGVGPRPRPRLFW